LSINYSRILTEHSNFVYSHLKFLSDSLCLWFSYSIWRNICSSCHSIFMHPSSICRISLQIQQYLKYLVSELENTIYIYIYICVCVHSTMNWLKTTTQKHTMKAFGNTVQPAFSKNLKSFFFLLKFNMICTFWIVLMCW
jgi:hypothetical protein